MASVSSTFADTRNSIAMAAMLESSALATAPPDFVRVLETQGLVYIEKHVRAEVVIPQLLSVVWPIFVILLLSTGYAAALIWLLVCAFTNLIYKQIYKPCFWFEGGLEVKLLLEIS